MAKKHHNRTPKVDMSAHEDAMGDRVASGAQWDAIIRLIKEASKGLRGNGNEGRTAAAAQLATQAIGHQAVTTILLSAAAKAKENAAKCRSCATNMGKATLGLDDYFNEVVADAESSAVEAAENGPGVAYMD